MQIGLVTTNTKQTNKGGWGVDNTQRDKSSALTHIKYDPIFNTVPYILIRMLRNKMYLCK